MVNIRRGNSIYKDYEKYDKEIVMLTIKVLSIQDRLVLQKKYGKEYMGTGYILNNEKMSYEIAKKHFEEKIKKIEQYVKAGKSEQEIIKLYKNNSSVYNVYSNYHIPNQNIKLKEKFIENFPQQYHNIVGYLLLSISEEDKKILEQFYWGKNYDVLKSNINYNKITDISKLINKLRDESIKLMQNKSNLRKIKVLKNKEVKTNKNELLIDEVKKKGLLDEYADEDREKVLEIIEQFKLTNPNYYEIISKKYSGKQFQNKNDIKLTKEEIMVYKRAKAKIKKILKTNTPIVCGFLDYFPKESHEKVLEIIEQFKVTNPNYYEIISKKYSGENFENPIDKELSQQEQFSFYNARIKINSLLNDQKKLDKFLFGNQNGFLKDYEEKDRETVLKIINKFKITNPNYYEIISKKYNGEQFEINSGIKLTREEQILFNNAKVRINYLLRNPEKLIIFLSENSETDINLENGKFDEKMLNLYISSLDKISNESAIKMIIRIAKYYPNKIIDIINSSYIKNKFNYLTQKEQIYIYLSLLSYKVTSLTKKKISQILDVEESFLDEYQIMTPNDNVNELNKLIKK